MLEDSFNTYAAKEARASRLRGELLPANKAVLFQALASSGIDTVTIDFDGSSDDGCFQAPIAFGNDNAEMALPKTAITIRTAVFETGVVEDAAISVGGYLEQLASDCLDEKHRYWEDGEGAFGEFRFSVPDQTITLEYNERYVDHHHHEYSF